MKDLWMVFASVFLAELGDKTQLATLMFATNEKINKLGVFAASSLALILSCLLAVAFGNQISAFISPEKLKIIVGLGFIFIGIWTLKDVLFLST
jgi:putative Ca2+/H+ antiporter (TMEM165/GDT1 family)